MPLSPDRLAGAYRQMHVIRKYVNVDVEAIQVNFEREGGQEVLELSVALPDRQVAERSVPEPA